MMIIEAQVEEGKRFSDIMIFLATIKDSNIPEIKKLLVDNTIKFNELLEQSDFNL